MSTTSADLPAFAGRHIGPRDEDIATMLSVVGRTSLDDLLDAAVPDGIRALEALDIEPAASEAAQDRFRRALASTVHSAGSRGGSRARSRSGTFSAAPASQ